VLPAHGTRSGQCRLFVYVTRPVPAIAIATTESAAAPVTCRPCRSVRSLSVRRPGLSPPRRSCILLAIAAPLRLRTHATAPCYSSLNDRSSDATGAMGWRRNHPPIRQLSWRPVCCPVYRAKLNACLKPMQATSTSTSPAPVGVFVRGRCSARIDDGGTISQLCRLFVCLHRHRHSRAHDPGSPVSPSLAGEFLFQDAAPAMASAAIA
jgi:hypothetical protein